MNTIALHRSMRADTEQLAEPLIAIDAVNSHPWQMDVLRHRLVGAALLQLPFQAALIARLDGRGSIVETQMPGRIVTFARTHCRAD
ncbi:MAG: hypothetical protein ACYC42_10630 [Lysobacter sp.]